MQTKFAVPHTGLPLLACHYKQITQSKMLEVRAGLSWWEASAQLLHN